MWLWRSHGIFLSQNSGYLGPVLRTPEVFGFHPWFSASIVGCLHEVITKSNWPVHHTAAGGLKISRSSSEQLHEYKPPQGMQPGAYFQTPPPQHPVKRPELVLDP